MMHTFFFRKTEIFLYVILFVLMPLHTWAGPGAHGPNGEHLDVSQAAVKISTSPRMEAKSENFELVAELRLSELVIIVDRYETNDPVLGAKIEVESNGFRAVASFRPESGDYVVTEASLLKDLMATGEHGLVFTLVSGAESDLLDGTLVTAAGQTLDSQGYQVHRHEDHVHEFERTTWFGVGLVTFGIIGVYAWRRQRLLSSSVKKGAF